jgi:hypothetical protein
MLKCCNPNTYKIFSRTAISQPQIPSKVLCPPSFPLEKKSEMKVFVVEDAPQIRQNLVELLAAREGFEVVGQAGSVHEALAG